MIKQVFIYAIWNSRFMSVISFYLTKNLNNYLKYIVLSLFLEILVFKGPL